MKDKIEMKIKESMKNGDSLTRDTLRVLKGEIERNEQTKAGKVVLTDSDILKLVKKMVEGMKETEPDSLGIPILEAYLPKQMTNDELVDELNKFISENKIDSMKGLGLVMKHFSTNFNGLYDGAVLSNLIKSKF
jgi:uncharacterized protein YqeY